MKTTSTLLLSIIMLISVHINLVGQNTNRCSTDEFIAEKQLQDPSYGEMQDLWRAQMTPEYLDQYKVGNCLNPTVLPIQFHFESSYQTCIEDAMMDQLQILNEDYSGTNADITDFGPISGSYAANTLAADGACVQFCLVGSTYGQYSENTNSWPNNVINVFVGNLGYGLLGYAECAGCPANGTTQSRIVIGQDYFGPNNPGCTVTGSFPFNLGRTLTHEMGHFLGLEHTWGNFGGCGNDDGIADTPSQDGPNYGCNTTPPSSCGSPDLFCSYMDYSDDACMFMYSQGQAAAMNAWISGNLQNAVNFAATNAACATSQPCPTFVSGSLPDAGFCEGTTADFNAIPDNVVINDAAGGTIVWTADYPLDAGGYEIPSPDAIQVSTGTCEPLPAAVYWNLVCTADGSVITTLGPATFTAYPDLSQYISLQNDGQCGPFLDIDPDCDVDVINTLDANGASPDFTSISGPGSLFFLVSSSDAPAACAELNISANYDCAVVQVPGCTDPDACNYDAAANYDDGSCIVVAGGTISTADVTTVCIGDGTSDIVNATVTGESGPAYAYVVTDEYATTILAGPDPSGSFDFDGAPAGTCLIWGIAYDPNDLDIPTDQVADITGCFSLSNSIPVIREDCAVPGCTDADACNFNPDATEDDGSCDFSCLGCTDPTACNYNADATIDDASCEFTSCADCEGVPNGAAVAGTACDDGDATTLNDVYQADCSCAGEAVLGCMDACATNYDPAATQDDGSCIDGNGCNDPTALNYDADAVCDDGSCIYTCYSGAGTVMVNTFCVCEGDQAIADADDFILSPGQSVYYVYHTDGMITDTNLPVNVVSLGSFINNDATVSGTVYVTAFGAFNDGMGGPDFSDPCLVYSNTVAISMLDPIVVYTEEFCDEDKGEFSYIFTVCGGLPDKVPGETYQITSDYFNGEIVKGDSITVGPITANTSYTITASDNEGCSVTITNDYMCFPVPVTLVSYTGSVETDGNLLKWSTASEIENDFYTLESSTDAVNFKTIGQVDGLGTISTASNYSFLDREATSGTSYYRLSQTDYDGTHEVLGVVQLTRDESTFTIDNIYPMPVNNELTLQFNNTAEETVNITIYDAAGKIFYSENYDSKLGINNLNINTEDFSSGVYFLGINSGENSLNQKFIKE